MRVNHYALLLLVCLALICLPAAAQHDSALQRLLLMPDDTLKVEQLNIYGNSIIDLDQKRSKAVYQASLDLSMTLHYANGLGAYWLAIGYMEAKKGNYQQAISDFIKAVPYFDRAGKTERRTRCFTNIGAMYELTGKPDSAMLYYMQAASYLENNKQLAALGNVYCSIGILHGNNKRYDKAVWYKTKALAIARQQKDSTLLVEALTELADTYGEMNQPALGIPLAYEALPIVKKRDLSNELGTTYYTLSALQIGLKRADSAIINAQQSIQHTMRSGDTWTRIGSMICLSDGFNEKNRQPERLDILKQALALGLKSDAIILLDDVYKKMADANYKIGNYSEAYTNYLRYTFYKDSALNEKNGRIISEFEVKYETAQKEKALSQNQLQLTQKNLQLQRERDYIYYSLGGLLVAMLLMAIIILQARHKKLAYARQLESMQQQKELQLLQAVMQGEERERSRIAKDLHDGVAGMLAAVKMHFSSLAPDHKTLDQTEGYRQGMHLLNEAASELRKTSHNLMPEVLFQYGLDEALRRYCSSLNNSRMLEVQYDSWGTISRFHDSFELSVYRIVQELINNIIKHSRASRALVQVSQQDNLLSISIEDNGVGFSSRETGQDGMGLRSLHSRVNAMNGRIELETAPDSGVTAYLEFETAGLQKETNVLI